MSKIIKPFAKPIYVSPPLLPDLSHFKAKLKEVWKDKWISNNGKQLLSLESKLLKILKVSNISIFNNGTTALLLGIKSLNLSGEVITTPFSFPATVNTLLWNNLTPIFCDIDPLTMNIDANLIEKCITPKTSAILALHTFGIPCDVAKIGKIAKKYNLKVIYDAAHAFKVDINNKGIGDFGDLTMFSFHATKIFNTAEGGALTYSDSSLTKNINLLRNFGLNAKGESVLPGLNGKMNEIQAALGLLELQYVDDEIKLRKEVVQRYVENLKQVDGIVFTQIPKNVKWNYQYLVIRIQKDFGKSRDYVHEQLQKFNVFSKPYFIPLDNKLSVTNEIGKEVLAMPLYGSLRNSEIDKICDIIKNIKG